MSAIFLRVRLGAASIDRTSITTGMMAFICHFWVCLRAVVADPSAVAMLAFAGLTSVPLFLWSPVMGMWRGRIRPAWVNDLLAFRPVWVNHLLPQAIVSFLFLAPPA